MKFKESYWIEKIITFPLLSVQLTSSVILCCHAPMYWDTEDSMQYLLRVKQNLIPRSTSSLCILHLCGFTWLVNFVLKSSLNIVLMIWCIFQRLISANIDAKKFFIATCMFSFPQLLIWCDFEWCLHPRGSLCLLKAINSLFPNALGLIFGCALFC